MEVAGSAASWVLGKALGLVTDGLLEAWAASAGLGPNVDALKMELLYAQGMLDNTRGREIRSPALKELLLKLRQLAYNADDVLDELEYFRIQDELDGTHHAAGEHNGGCLRNHALNARHTAKAVGKMLGFSTCSSAASRGDSYEPNEAMGGVCCCRGAWPSRGQSTPDEEQKEDTNRGVLCGVAWPCAGQITRETNSSLPPPPTHQAEEEVGSRCLLKLASGARSTINSLGKHLPCYSVPPVQNDANTNMASNRRLICCAGHNNAALGHREAPKLKFNRVEMSKKMREIVEQLKPVCAKVSTILNLELLDSNRSIAQCIAMSLDSMLTEKQGFAPLLTNSIAMSRPKTTSEFIEPELYGRKDEENKIFSGITEGEYRDKDLTVLPIVGPGGIGKTTLAQYIYKELQDHFDVKIWVCVSVNFSVHRLMQEIAEKLGGDKKHSPDKFIEEKLQSKKFLLVLDDMWNCSDKNEWKRLLVPLTKSQSKGNMILVTTRFPVLAEMVKTTDQLMDLKGLDPETFKNLFYACIFGDPQSRNGYSWLLDTGDRIADKLKGSPLAAKTVGRLLRNHFDLDHWTRILESKEWESQSGDHDIMPALKLSYDYLPFHLQQCFTYCALFPEDYKFEREEITHFWIGLDALHSYGENKRIEDIGLIYLTELVNHGFFKKEEDDEEGHTFYIIHDLLHELALKVSSHECVRIYSSNVTAIQIPPSVRHMSISIDDTSVKDRKTFDTCKKDLSTLEERLIGENLRSLMLFGQHSGSFMKTFGGLLKKAKSLRVIFLSGVSYNMEDLLHQRLIHLRYLRIKSYNQLRLPSNISRFYHLRVLDIHRCNAANVSPRGMSKLINLRHLLVEDNEVHSSIPEVGKLKFLQELTRFFVKQETRGFELREIGKLVELHGSLHIANLEKVELKEEADEAELMHKNHLHELTLDWDINRSNQDHAREEQVLESLKPSSNLLKLCIRGHGGSVCPSWLGMSLAVKNLESFHLHGVAWKKFPPIGDLWLANEHGEELSGNVSHQKFLNLRKLELVGLPQVKKWVGDAPCQLFPLLEVLTIKDCFELMELSFSHSICCQQKKEANMNWFPKLQELEIIDCPKLLSFPPIPWTKAPCSVTIEGVGSGCNRLFCGKDFESEYSLQIEAKGDSDSTFWSMLSFHNLTELKELELETCPAIPLHQFQMLSCLKSLKIDGLTNVFLLLEDESQVEYRFPIECLKISSWDASGKELTQLLAHFPKLSNLEVGSCKNITALGVVGQQTTAPAPAPSPPGNKVGDGQMEQQRRHDARGEEEIATPAPSRSSTLQETESSSTPAPSSPANKVAAAQLEEHQWEKIRGEEEIATPPAEGLLLLPPQLQALEIYECKELILRCNTHGDHSEAERTGEGGGLQGLHSLRSLTIFDGPKFLSSYSSSSSSGFPFPSSLEDLSLEYVKGMETLMPLSNLTSLTSLSIQRCEDLRGAQGMETLMPLSNLTSLTSLSINSCRGLRGEGLWPLLDQGHLTKLTVENTPNFFVGSEPSRLQEQEPPSRSSRLQELETDDARGFLAAPICTLLSSSLTKLDFWGDKEVERFTKEQDEALQLLTSLQEIQFLFCDKLQCLPAGLHRLPNLKTLWIQRCPAIRSLPKDCLPSSLQLLRISFCPAILSLPKVDDLPSSLRELHVDVGNSEELRRQCRKLIGTIPIVYA